MMNGPESFCYISRKPCGCINGVCLIEPKFPKSAAKFCSDAIRNGYSIERMTVTAAKADPKYLARCECGKTTVGGAQ